MHAQDVSPALQERLGLDATEGLLDLFETARRDWSSEVTNLAIERFERRLSAELSALRLELREEISRGDTHLREELRNSTASLREELRNGTASLREEVRDQVSALRVDMSTLRSELAQSISTLEVNLTRRTFAMWIGQLVAMAAIVAAMFQIAAF